MPHHEATAESVLKQGRRASQGHSKPSTPPQDNDTAGNCKPVQRTPSKVTPPGDQFRRRQNERRDKLNTIYRLQCTTAPQSWQEPVPTPFCFSRKFSLTAVQLVHISSAHYRNPFFSSPASLLCSFFPCSEHLQFATFPPDKLLLLTAP